MNVLSISSHVAYGHVGNSAAVFALQRLGVEAWPDQTVRYSNPPGHGRHRGAAASAAEITEIVAGLDDIGALAECDAILSGYFSRADTMAAARDAVATVKSRNPEAIYLCDPVMGDVGAGLYVADEVRGGMNACVAAADIAIPNAFELETLTARPSGTVDGALAAADRLRDLGPGIVVVTGVEGEAGSIATMAVAADGAWRVTTPRLDLGRRADGAGDVLAAVFLAHFLESRDPAAALSAATSSVFGVIDAARAGGGRDLPLIAAQSELVAPSRVFEAETLR